MDFQNGHHRTLDDDEEDGGGASGVLRPRPRRICCEQAEHAGNREDVGEQAPRPDRLRQLHLRRVRRRVAARRRAARRATRRTGVEVAARFVAGVLTKLIISKL